MQGREKRREKCRRVDLTFRFLLGPPTVFETESVMANQRAARKAWLGARSEQGMEEETESRWIEDPEEAKRVSLILSPVFFYRPSDQELSLRSFKLSSRWRRTALIFIDSHILISPLLFSSVVFTDHSHAHSSRSHHQDGWIRSPSQTLHRSPAYRS